MYNVGASLNPFRVKNEEPHAGYTLISRKVLEKMTSQRDIVDA